jgi:hypothetical protein
MTNYRRIIAGLFITVIIGFLFGFARLDDDPLAKIAAQLVKWTSAHPVEKVYLHLDKPYYAIGDNIWFKAYVTAGPGNRLSAISGVLNVDLIDDRDSVKHSMELPVVNGLTWGNFLLPDSMKEGNYRIRAYTNWMRNAGEDYFFDKTITIVNAVTNNVFTNASYSFNTQKDRQQVNAAISYADLSGTPYANTDVNYEVEIGPKIIEKGKGKTDDKGILNISFSSNNKSASPGHIVTKIKLSDNKWVEKQVLIKAVSGNVDLQFFPEGGNLVIGNDSKIAFKAVGADGLGAAIKGVIVDEDNKQVASFNSSHAGMGVFNMIPETGKTYKARVTYADGSENTVDLPKAVNTGYTLNIDNSDAANISVKIIPGSAVKVSADETGVMSLVGQSGGVIYYAGKSKPGSKFFTAVVPKSKFPTGIVQFTLFSSTAEPLNERLVFVDNHDQLKVDITSDRQTYQTRQKVKVGLNAKDAAGKPVVGSFSVSVIDETRVPVDEEEENTILSNLLLTSDLKGYVEKPNYYFTDPDEKKAADLDVLMLTQGYHRFEWKEVLNESFPPVVYQPAKTLEISGHLKTLFGKPVANGKVTLMTNQGGFFIVDTVTDNQGRFTFKNLIFKDSVRFLIQGRTAKDRKNLQIDLDNITPQRVGSNKNFADLQVNISDGLSPFLKNSKLWYAGQVKYGLISNSILLKQVEIKAKKINPAEHSTNLNGPGNADQVVSGDAVPVGCARITDCLQGMLTGVVFRNDTPYSTRSMRTPMQIIIDGVYVDPEVLNNMNSVDIESIEVLRNAAYTSIYGGRGGGGLLIVTSKRGGADNVYKRYAPGIITYMPKGYNKIREFYSPRYDDPKTNTQIPDLRSTIYWKPNIITGNDGKAEFDYFNADNKGTYRVVIEGIDNNGNLGRQVYRYKVE